MKHGKKLVSLLLALVMVMGLAVTAMADETTKTGSITISNPVDGESYDIYKMFDLESYNTSGDHAYKITNDWEDFVTTGAGKDYFQLDGEYVTVKKNVTIADNSDTAANLAKDALAYAKEKKLDPVAKLNETTGFTKTGLALGYYLVDSSLGTLCSLDTTNPNVTMREKNGVPTNEKTVEEDSTGEYGKTNDADIGQTVNFKSTITAQAGAENYVFHDKMSAGLTFGSVTGITLTRKESTTNVDSSKYTVKEEISDGCTFEVVFTKEFCDTLEANDKIVISYTATLNANAVVGLPGNPNESKLSYGDSSNTKYTTPSQTITYTWDMDILKYGNGKESNVLADAKFVLLNKDKNKIATVANGKITGWVDLPGKDKTFPENTVLTTGADGKIQIDGLDADTYYLREIEAPAGYNKLAEDKEVVITGATKAEGSDTLTYTTVVEKVNNNSGTELPSTGGIGTTIFYVIGGILVLGAAVLLVTRKRMDA